MARYNAGMLTIALTADLHWGIRPAGDAATLQLVSDLAADPPDVLVLGGDVGAGGDFERCLKLFANLPGRKALIPGNHDVWVEADDARGDSWHVYSKHLPALCNAHGFHYLDHGPLVLPDEDLAIVGSMNWYDWSWGQEPGWEPPADFEERLRDMRFTRGRHNDARFVRWRHTNQSFTAHAVTTLEGHLEEALQQVGRVIVVTHHPAFRGLNFPDPGGPPHVDRMLWRAFSGNVAMEELLTRHADRIALVFSGHTHRVRDGRLGPIAGHNIGGDYDWKRLLRLRWPDTTLEVKEFPA
jgi:predicted phosphohydrolase